MEGRGKERDGGLVREGRGGDGFEWRACVRFGVGGWGVEVDGMVVW